MLLWLCYRCYVRLTYSENSDFILSTNALYFFLGFLFTKYTLVNVRVQMRPYNITPISKKRYYFNSKYPYHNRISTTKAWAFVLILHFQNKQIVIILLPVLAMLLLTVIFSFECFIPNNGSNALINDRYWLLVGWFRIAHILIVNWPTLWMSQ